MLTEQGYEIVEDNNTSDRRARVRAVTVSERSVSIVGALESQDGSWTLVAYDGTGLLPVAALPSRAITAADKDAAMQWLHFTAALYAKAVAA